MGVGEGRVSCVMEERAADKLVPTVPSPCPRLLPGAALRPRADEWTAWDAEM